MRLGLKSINLMHLRLLGLKTTSPRTNSPRTTSLRATTTISATFKTAHIGCSPNWACHTQMLLNSLLGKSLLLLLALPKIHRSTKDPRTGTNINIVRSTKAMGMISRIVSGLFQTQVSNPEHCGQQDYATSSRGKSISRILAISEDLRDFDPSNLITTIGEPILKVVIPK